MARQLLTDPEIDHFIAKVMDEAHHHVSSVENVIQPLSDAVRAKLNLSKDKIELYKRNGELARTCWITINARRYVFSYNYSDAKIELRTRSTQGEIMFSFDNTTAPDTINSEVGKL